MIRDELGMATNDVEDLDSLNNAGLRKDISKFVINAEVADIMSIIDEFVMRGFWVEAVKQALLAEMDSDRGSLKHYSFDDADGERVNVAMAWETALSNPALHTSLEAQSVAYKEAVAENIKNIRF